MTTIEGSVALATGGSRGIGEALVRELQTRGAANVYATARDPQAITTPGVLRLPLELTNPDAATALVQQAPDVTILINNAGGAVPSSFLDSPSTTSAVSSTSPSSGRCTSPGRARRSSKPTAAATC